MGLAERLPYPPAGMNRETALAYTGVSEAQLRAWERGGKVSFRPRGPHGSMLALRVDLEAALMALYESPADQGIDFGDD